MVGAPEIGTLRGGEDRQDIGEWDQPRPQGMEGRALQLVVRVWTRISREAGPEPQSGRLIAESGDRGGGTGTDMLVVGRVERDVGQQALDRGHAARLRHSDREAADRAALAPVRDIWGELAGQAGV